MPPLVRIDPLYASYGALMTLVPNGVPSLRTCTSLRVEGLVVFGRDVCITGDVAIVNPHGASRTLRAGWYRNQTVTFAPEKPATPKERGGLERKFGAHVKEQGGGLKALNDAFQLAIFKLIEGGLADFEKAMTDELSIGMGKGRFTCARWTMKNDRATMPRFEHGVCCIGEGQYVLSNLRWSGV